MLHTCPLILEIRILFFSRGLPDSQPQDCNDWHLHLPLSITWVHGFLDFHGLSDSIKFRNVLKVAERRRKKNIIECVKLKEQPPRWSLAGLPLACRWHNSFSDGIDAAPDPKWSVLLARSGVGYCFLNWTIKGCVWVCWLMCKCLQLRHLRGRQFSLIFGKHNPESMQSRRKKACGSGSTCHRFWTVGLFQPAKMPSSVVHLICQSISWHHRHGQLSSASHSVLCDSVESERSLSWLSPAPGSCSGTSEETKDAIQIKYVFNKYLKISEEPELSLFFVGIGFWHQKISTSRLRWSRSRHWIRLDVGNDVDCGSPCAWSWDQKMTTASPVTLIGFETWKSRHNWVPQPEKSVRVSEASRDEGFLLCASLLFEFCIQKTCYCTNIE